MMRPISWLHISDFHLRDSQAWAQDVVLSAMCKDIERCRREIGALDFVLATGDLAFAGKVHEYSRTSAFFDEVARVTGVPRERIFCVPGNHDVDRDRQKMCFAGARHLLQSQNEVDSFLGAPDELGTLLQRQEAYCHFQETYFSNQMRTRTADGLGYVSTLEIEDLKITIAGINTAWLAEGGASDHGKLLAGERQVINALQLATEADAHIVIAIAHHPFHLLNDFDRRTVQRRIEEACHFYQCGHLHDAEARDALHTGSQCLTIAAGASFESRHAQNAFSLISLNVMQAQLTVRTVQYKPTDGAFSYENCKSLPFTINAVQAYSLAELGEAIASSNVEVSPVSYYLAALLTEAQAEMPISVGSEHVFGSFDFLCDQADSELKAASIAFMAVRNPLRLFSRRMQLAAFIERYGGAILQYGTSLIGVAKLHPELGKRLAEREEDARTLAKAEPLKPFYHTLALFHELAEDHDWEALRQHAERHLCASEPVVAVEARRMLALSLAQSSDETDKVLAIALCEAVVESDQVTASDFAVLASLLTAIKDYDGAMAALRKGIGEFPDNATGYLPVGQLIVEATGDRAFRDELNSLHLRRSTD